MSGPSKATRPRGMDCSTWAAFRRAWNATPSLEARTQLCAEYGVTLDTAERFTRRGVGLHRYQQQHQHRRAGG